MGEGVLFQICHEGDLTVEVSDALRRIGAEPNFDQSWRLQLDQSRPAGVLVRYLRMMIGPQARLLAAPLQRTRRRDLILVRHSMTPGADYRELHDALERLGWVLELPFESTFIVESDEWTDARRLGEALVELCPDESLMVTGIGGDFAWCVGSVGPMMLTGNAVAGLSRVRTF